MGFSVQSFPTFFAVISPSEKNLPARFNMHLIGRLQKDVAPQVFTPRAAYDGHKNFFAARALLFQGGTHEVFLSLKPRFLA